MAVSNTLCDGMVAQWELGAVVTTVVMAPCRLRSRAAVGQPTDGDTPPRAGGAATWAPTGGLAAEALACPRPKFQKARVGHCRMCSKMCWK